MKIVSFLREVVSEFKLISWPSKPQLWGSTKTVIGFSVCLVVFIFAVDFLLNKLVGFFI